MSLNPSMLLQQGPWPSWGFCWFAVSNLSSTAGLNRKGSEFNRILPRSVTVLFDFATMYGATGTACSTRHQSTNLSDSSGRSCYRHLPRIPGNFSSPFNLIAQPLKQEAGCTLRTLPCRASSCRRTPLPLPSLVPTPVLRRRIAYKLRSVNEPSVTQSISNEDEPEVVSHNGSQLSEEGSHPEVHYLALC